MAVLVRIVEDRRSSDLQAVERHLRAAVERRDELRQRLRAVVAEAGDLRRRLRFVVEPEIALVRERLARAKAPRA